MNNNDSMFAGVPENPKDFNIKKMTEKPISNTDLLKIYDDYPRLKREYSKISKEYIDLLYKVHKDLNKDLVTPPQGMTVRDVVKSRNQSGLLKVLTKIEKHVKKVEKKYDGDFPSVENESDVDVGDYDMNDDFIDNTDEVPLTEEQLNFLRSDEGIKGYTNNDENIRNFKTAFEIEQAKQKKKTGGRRRTRRKSRRRKSRKTRRKRRRKRGSGHSVLEEQYSPKKGKIYYPKKEDGFNNEFPNEKYIVDYVTDNFVVFENGEEVEKISLPYYFETPEPTHAGGRKKKKRKRKTKKRRRK